MSPNHERLVLTIGHSTRPLEAFLDILEKNGVTLAADIRTVPRSRHNPQFNKDVLPGELARVNIGYKHMAGLGGFRHTIQDSVNTGWRNSSFRGFADYMQTEEFAAEIETLITLAGTELVCIMCAEAVPWRCHRSLIADALTVSGLRVEHILNEGERRSHTLTPFARVEGNLITYPG